MEDNKTCWFSGEPLDGSMEHIIPNAIGGHLKSKYLVCEKVNTEFFKPLDIALTEHLSVFDSRQYKRDDGKKKNSTLKLSKKELCKSIEETFMKKEIFLDFKEMNNKLSDTSSEIFYKYINGTPVLSGMEPFDFEKERVKIMPLKQFDEVANSELKKNPYYDKEKVLAKGFKFIIDGSQQYSTAKGSFSPFYSINQFKEIVKIALNFAVYNNCNIEYLKEPIQFLKGEIVENKFVSYLNTISYIKYERGKSEVSHILHFKGCSKEKLLYCYVELFNLHSLIVVLNDNYTGNDIEAKNYIWDLDLAKRLEDTKDFQFHCTSKDLSNNFNFNKLEFEKNYIERLMRLSNLWQLNIVKKKK